MRFFTSDTHFGHANIIRLSGRPASDIDAHDEMLIERWNSVVKPTDAVIHLGDVALGQIATSLPKVSRLNGQKFLVAGNHDRIFSGNKPNQIDRFRPEYRKVFDVILPENTSLTLANGMVVNVSHFPYSGDHFTEDRYPDHRPFDDGRVLIHGHVHDMWATNGRQINVGVDVRNFTPISEDELIDTIESLF